MRSSTINRDGQLVLNMAAPYEIQTRSEREYVPLGSVWEGEDSELLERLMDLYPRKRPEKILDATLNSGRFWRGRNRPVVGLDIQGKYRPHVAGDNMLMPFRKESFDAVVYDPPHIPNQGRDNEKDFSVRFGLVLKSSKDNDYNAQIMLRLIAACWFDPGEWFLRSPKGSLH